MPDPLARQVTLASATPQPAHALIAAAKKQKEQGSMVKLYSVTVFDAGRAVVAFMATLEKARLRSIIYRQQGLTCSRPAYCPKFSRRVADQVARGQIVAPQLRL